MLVGRKGNPLALDVPDGLGTTHTDVVNLRQCLFSLLSNAAKFTEGYANEVARQLTGLERTPNWDPNALEGRVMRRP